MSTLSTQSDSTNDPLKPFEVKYTKRNDGRGLYVNSNNPEKITTNEFDTCLTRQEVTDKDVFFTFEHNNANNSFSFTSLFICLLCFCFLNPQFGFNGNELTPLSSLLSSIQFSRSVMSDSLQSHELQHARLPCPSPTPRAYIGKSSTNRGGNILREPGFYILPCRCNRRLGVCKRF